MTEKDFECKHSKLSSIIFGTLCVINFIVLGVVIFFVIIPLQKQKSQYKEAAPFVSKILTIENLIKENFYHGVSLNEIRNNTLKGMVHALDPNSTYLDKNDLKEMEFETSGKLYGIGIEVNIENGLLTVISPIENTPASRAGLMPGDVIHEINGEKTENLSLFETTSRIRGEPNTPVRLKIQKNKTKKIEDITIIREEIKIQSVKSVGIVDEDSKIGYMRIVGFKEDTIEEFMKAFKTLEGRGMRSLIVDLRFNPGGLLEVGLKFVDLFLKEGKIITMKGVKEEKVFTAKKEECEIELPLVILTNEGSASASELVSAALQENNRAKIVGELSYGKGSVQTIYTLGDNTALKLTTAKFHSPKGRLIDKEKNKNYGVVPDYIVELSQEEKEALIKSWSKKSDDTSYEAFEDRQLQKAIEVCKEKF